MFSLGAQLSVARGLRGAATVSLAGCALVGLLAALTSIVGSRSRLSTYQLLAYSFGVRGARFVNLILGVMLIGWFATTGAMLGAAVHDAIRQLFGFTWPDWLITSIALVLMTLTGIFGFRVMESFARITVPLLLTLMTYVVWLAVHGKTAHGFAAAGDNSLSAVDALSSVIGAIILTAVLAPDLTRYARTDRDALFSVAGLAIGFPLALILAAIPASILNRIDVMAIMAVLGLPGIGVLILVMSTWTSNTSNLYSSTLTLATFFPRISSQSLGAGAAVIALSAAILGIADHFIPMLIGLGVVSAPLAGVYVMDFFAIKKQRYDPADLAKAAPVSPSAFVAWAAGASVGLVTTYSQWSLTKIPAVDSIVAAALIYFLIKSRPHTDERT